MTSIERVTTLEVQQACEVVIWLLFRGWPLLGGTIEEFFSVSVNTDCKYKGY